MDISKIKIDNINDELCRVTYGQLEVIFIKENNYVNMDILWKYGIKENGNKKEFIG